jgi:hypothetical protein
MFNAKSKYIFGKYPSSPIEKIRWDLQKIISRRCLLLACVFAASLSLNAQKLLQTWPVGVPLCYVNWYDDGTYTIDTTGKWTPYRQDASAAVIQDLVANELLFQSNGCKVADKGLKIIENGDSLVDNEYYHTYNGVGIPTTQVVIALPRDADTWWVFVMSFSDSAWKIKNTSNPVPSPDRLYAAIVDINANNGAGKVIAKKIPVHKGLMGDCRLTACRHANGRDWWLVNHGWNDSVYNKWLVTPDSIYGVFRDTAGTLHKEPDLYGMAQFSLDGTKYAMGSGNGLINIFNFDRCIGNFFNLKTINNEVLPPWSSTSLSPICGLSFSPNGNMLYTSN